MSLELLVRRKSPLSFVDRFVAEKLFLALPLVTLILFAHTTRDGGKAVLFEFDTLRVSLEEGQGLVETARGRFLDVVITGFLGPKMKFKFKIITSMK